MRKAASDASRRAGVVSAAGVKRNLQSGDPQDPANEWARGSPKKSRQCHEALIPSRIKDNDS
jgi:hypothetical protein